MLSLVRILTVLIACAALAGPRAGRTLAGGAPGVAGLCSPRTVCDRVPGVGTAGPATGYASGGPSANQDVVPTGTVSCSAITLRLRPGLNRSSNTPPGIAPDIPHGPFSVSLPLYPGAVPVYPLVDTPFPQLPDDPYLQTASAEYRSAVSPKRVKAWFNKALPACGWRADASWTGNALAFTSGRVWVSIANPDLSVDVSFGGDPSGGTDMGYGVAEITLPPRPARSFLHGPFVRVQLTLQRRTAYNVQVTPLYLRVTVRDRAAIQGLAHAIDAIRGYRTVQPFCTGGLSSTGPAWLSFVRPNGTAAHAFETGPGVCGGLAVNGVRWLTDTGAVWSRILALSGVRG